LHKALVCDIAVGRSFTIDEKSAEKEALPKGYDSFYLADDNKKDNEYYYEYYIKSQEKVLFI
jgi:hypothetical protein